MSLHGTCEICGYETIDYSCINCLYREIEELEYKIEKLENGGNKMNKYRVINTSLTEYWIDADTYLYQGNGFHEFFNFSESGVPTVFIASVAAEDTFAVIKVDEEKYNEYLAEQEKIRESVKRKMSESF